MSTPAARRILFVAPKREAQPVLSQLRSSGHQVSLVEDLDEAGAILGISTFDQAVLPGSSLEFLLEQKNVWDGLDSEGWRRSTAAIVHDLRGLLAAVGLVVGDFASHAENPDDRHIGAISNTVKALSKFADELVHELSASPGAKTVSAVDLEDAAEAAAVVVYPSAIEREQKLVIDIDQDVAVVKTNALRLKRILKNVLEFASFRAPDNASVTIRASRDEDDCVISVSCDAGEVSRSELNHIFSRTSGNGGLTRPLVLAQQIVDQLDGRMWVESEKSGGVSVFIAIPHRQRRSMALAHRRKDA